MSARWGSLRSDDDGFTLVELLVSIILLSVLMAALLTTVLAAQRSAESTLGDHDRTEEARLALNRVSRELRQAVIIERAVNARGAGHDPAAITAVTFQADFNGDGCINGVAPAGFTGTCLANDPGDPEVVSYCHEPAAVAAGTPRLYVIAGQLSATLTGCAGGQPILAEQVDGFGLEFRSRQYRLDSNADGVTSWEELDAGLAPFGNQNGVLDAELTHVDSVVVHLDLNDGHGREFRTQIALRNQT